MLSIPILFIQSRGEPVILWEDHGVLSLAEYDILPLEAKMYMNTDDTHPVLDLRWEYTGEIKEFVESQGWKTTLGASKSLRVHRGGEMWYITLDLVFEEDADAIYFKMWQYGE